jgi:formyltetrahydrofolate-dependent phosphoribosylglycinamide formyltransferase
MTKLKLAILISGRGSNMGSILTAAEEASYPLEPALVLSNRPDADGNQIAQTAGIPTAVIDHQTFGKDRQAFESAMDASLREHKIDLVALAGFMRILTPWFVTRWEGRLVNIHPSLLPKYPGLHTHQRAIDAGDTEAGCSVHWVTEGVDEGEVIAQASVAIDTGDTAESLAQKILPLEHALYPKALAKAATQIKPRGYA